MTKTARTYAGALYDLALDEQLTDRILSDLQLVRTVFQENPDYRKLMSEPSIQKNEREALLDEAWRSNIHLYTLNFMKLLCDNGTLNQIADCESEFRRRYNSDHGILEVHVTSAQPISDEMKNKLQEKLEKNTGMKVNLSICIDESLIGGIRLEYSGKELDGTVRHHLDSIAHILHA